MEKKPEGRSKMTYAIYQIGLALSGLLVAGGLFSIGTPSVWWIPTAISIFASVTKFSWALKIVPVAVVGSIAFGLLRFYDDTTQIWTGFIFLGAFVAIVSSQALDRKMRPFGGAPRNDRAVPLPDIRHSIAVGSRGASGVGYLFCLCVVVGGILDVGFHSRYFQSGSLSRISTLLENYDSPRSMGILRNQARLSIGFLFCGGSWRLVVLGM